MTDKLFTFAAIFSIFVSACGGSGGSPTTTGVTATVLPPPSISASLGGEDISSSALSFSEGNTITLSIDSTNSSSTSATLVQTSGPTIDFGSFTVGGFSADGNLSLSDDNFTLTLSDKEGERTASFEDAPLLIDVPLPAVNEDTYISLSFSYTNGVETVNETISFTVGNDAAASVVTISGVVSIGLISNARVVLIDASEELDTRLADMAVLAEDLTDENGQYTLTLDKADIPGDMVAIAAFLEGATMACITERYSCAENGGPGETFVITGREGSSDYDQTGPAPEFKDASLRAVINTPSGGTALNANLNLFTQFSFLRMLYLASQNDSVSDAGNIILRPEDISQSQLFIANVFGLSHQDFTQLDFVDIIQPIISTDQQAIRAGLLTGGYLQASLAPVSDDDNNLDFTSNFIEKQAPFFNRLIAYPDGSYRSYQVALSHIFSAATLVADKAATNGSTGEDFDSADQFISTRLNDIRNGPLDAPVNDDGSLPTFEQYPVPY